MNRIITLFLVANLFGKVSMAQTSTDKIVLKKDQKLMANITSSGTVSMQMMGQDLETISESSLSSTLQVSDVNTSGYSLTNTINKMKLKLKGGMTPAMDFDSDKKEDMESETGKTIKDKLKPIEEEITFTGKAVEKKDGAANEDIQKVMQSIMSGSGDEGITGFFMLLPSGKKVGDTWSDSSNKKGIKISNTYLLKQINGNEATVIINTISNIDKTVQAQGADLTITMDSKIISENTIDITNGIVKEKKMTVEGKGNLGAGGQDIPMKTKVTATINVKSI